MTALLDRLRLLHIREFTTHWGRTAGSIVVMAVSSMFLVAVLGISGSLTGSADPAGLAGDAALEVSGVTDAGFAEAVRTDVAAVPGVRVAAPVLRANAGPDDDPLLLLGLDATARELGGGLGGALDEDQLAALATVPGGVLAGPAAGYAKGDVVQLRSGRVTIAAVLGDDGGDLNDGHYLIAPLPLAQLVTGRAGQVDSVLLVTDPDADAAQVRSAVTAAVAGRALVGEPTIRAAQNGNGVLMVRLMAAMGAGIAFVVAAFLIYNTMSMALAGRRPVISMLRAIGGRRQTIVRDVLAEAAVLGLVGGAIGSALGVAAGRYAIGLLPAAFTQMLQARLEYLLPWYAIPAAIVAAVLTNVLATALAARQIYRMAPVEALAPVGAAHSDRVPVRARVVAGVLAVVFGVATALVMRAHLGLFAAVGLGFAFAAEIALAFALGGPIVRAAGALARRLGRAGVLAGVNIDRAPRRVWATTMTVCIAVTMTLTITGANADAVRSARDTFESLADSDLWVSVTPEDLVPTPLLPAEVAERVAAVPGVERVVQGQLAFATFAGTKALIYGVEPGGNFAMTAALDAETRERLLAGEGVVISRDLARTLGVSAGDEIPVQTPTGEQRTRVLAAIPYFSALTGAASMSLALMREWFDRPGASTLQVEGVPGGDREQLLADVRAALPPEVHVYTGDTALDGVSRSMEQGLVLSRVMLVLVAFIAAMALLNTLTLALLERRRELGILRAIGSSRRFALRMVLAEAAGIGLAGTALGVVFGLGNQVLYAYLAGDMMGLQITARPGPSLAVFAFAALALSLLGSIPPALRAARLNIVEAVSAD